MVSTLKDLDHIFVLSLKTSKDRQKKFKENFPEMQKLDIFEWFLVDKDTEKPERGCYTSHKNILATAKLRNYKTILVFEDDIKPLVPWNEFVNTFNNVQRPDNWKIIQFGYIPIKTTKTLDKHLFAVNCTYSAEAYLVNVPLVEILPDYQNIQVDCAMFCGGNSHIDIIMKPQLTNKLIQDVYAYNPRQFQHIFEDSDIGHDNSAISFFYKFYGLFCGDEGITPLSSSINLILLSFFIVFAVVVIVGVLIMFCLGRLL